MEIFSAALVTLFITLSAANAPAAPKAPPPQPVHPPAVAAVEVQKKKGIVQFALLPIEASIVKHTNAARKRNNLPPLKVDNRLVKSARRHAAWMASHRSLRHTSQPVAENIAMGQRSGRDAVRAWMNSSGHRANILSRGSRRIGIAAYRAADGAIYFCQQFVR